MMSLVSCNEGGTDSESIDGEYIMVEWKTGETDYTPVLENLDITMTIENNKATVKLMDGAVDWQVDTKEKVMRGDDGTEVPYRMEGNQLIVEGTEDGVYGKMVFDKK